MDTNSILEIFRQAVKGGRGPEDEAYTAGRQTQRFQDQVGAGRRPEMTEDEAYTAQRRNQLGGVDARRQYHNMFNPNLGGLSQFSEVDGGTEIEHGRNPHTRIHPSGQPFPDANEFYHVSDPFAPQQVRTQRVGTQRDWSNNPHTRTDWGPELPMNGVPISAEEFGLADQFAPRFPGVDDQLHELFMQRNNRAMPGSPVNY